MTPSVFTLKNNSKVDDQIQRHKIIKETISKYQEFVKKNFDYVGENFAYEARSAHYKNKKNSKGIYGTATKEDLKELKEEGIETELMPWIKDNMN